jgi:tricorn protease
MSLHLPALLLLLPAAVPAGQDRPYLVQNPTVSPSHIVFHFADDLWIVGREGGDARRLTTGTGVETDPRFSPDGKQVAFTGQYDGNPDVYVVSASGGQPRRLTYHPGTDRVIGWTPDGKRVLFQSSRNSYSRFSRLFTIPAEGGFPDELPLPMADHGCYSPDGKRLAYVPIRPAFRAWKRYRGGTATPIWLANLDDSSIIKVPRTDSNDFNPMWVGDIVYFLSDRNGPMTLFAYDLKEKNVRQVLENNGLDLKSASAGPDAIVYEQFGSIHLLDLESKRATGVPIHIHADLPNLRPRFEKVSRQIQEASLSPTGVRAVFEARGEILTVPASKGDIRNLTETTKVAERDPAWSPDGQRIAYFSDASGEYQLHVRDQMGKAKAKVFALGDAPSFYYSPVWSPDSKKIAYTDKRLQTWVLDLQSGKNTRIDSNTYAPRMDSPRWSPDSRWLVYARKLENHLHAIFLYSLQTGKKHQITDGMSDARHPTFDQSGKYLYFTASTDAGPSLGGIEMSNFNYPVTRSIYLVVLRKTDPSPLAPRSDEEKGSKTSPTAKASSLIKGLGGLLGKAQAKGKTQIDLENIDQRIIALPIPARNYLSLLAGKTGTLFLPEVEMPPVGVGSSRPSMTLYRFQLASRKTDTFLSGVSAASLSHNGNKMLVRQGSSWAVVSTASAPKSGSGTLKLDNMEVRIDPRAEFTQMYDEVWRIERDFLYDPGFHGLDLGRAAAKYRGYLEGVGSRRDLNYLFNEMLGELTLGHVYVSGGDSPETDRVRGGLLGADYTIDRGKYRFARIYPGENWDPSLRAPLTQPGILVKEGDYLLEVDGKEVSAQDNLYRHFEATAGKSVRLKVGPNPNGKGAREVKVVPIDSETSLRNRAWIEANRRKVEKLSQGKVGYVYLANTSVTGYRQFNRYFYAQVGKQGVVIDERFNGGGKAADYIIRKLGAPLINYWTTREGKVYSTPAGAIFGPKVMLINEMAGSGGDWLPWAFRRFKLGPLVGKRTWGGLVGIGGYPSLIDGGRVTAPHFAFYTPEGKWEVENHGVAPDVAVEFDPQAVCQGHDPQLEKAVELVLNTLKENPPPKPPRPVYPNYHKSGDLARPAGKPAGASR